MSILNINFEWNQVTKLSLMNFFINLFFLVPVSVFFYQQRGLNYFQILALESILVMVISLFEVPTGIFADRYGRKKSLIVGILLFICHPIILLFSHSFLFFAIAYILFGIGVTLHSGTIQALIYDYLKDKGKENEMSKAMGTFGSAAIISSIVALPIGSFLAQDLYMGQFALLLFMTTLAFIIGLFLALTIEDTQKKKVKDENPISTIKEGIKVISKNKSLIRIVLLSTLTISFGVIMNYLYQPYFKASGVAIALFGTIAAVGRLGKAFLRKYAYKIENLLGVGKSAFISTFLPGLFLLLMGFIFNPIGAVLLYLFWKVSTGVKKPLFSDYKNQHIPSKRRATVLSLISIIASIYLIIMRMVIGKIADYNLNLAFVLMGGIVIGGSIFLRIDENFLDRTTK